MTDLTPEALDEWRVREASKLEATDPRQVGELVEWAVMNEYRRLVREDVRPANDQPQGEAA